MKKKTKTNSATQLTSASPETGLARDDIAFAAYCLWEEHGRPAGRDLNHWLQAETLLRQARQSAVVQL